MGEVLSPPSQLIDSYAQIVSLEVDTEGHNERGERNRLLLVIVIAMIIAAAAGYGVDKGHRSAAADLQVKHQANSPPPESGPAWPIKLIATGNFSEIFAGDRVLYLTQGNPTTGVRIVRMNPINGRITARSAILNGSVLDYADHELLVGATTAQGNPVLFTLNANTLKITRRLVLGAQGYILTPVSGDSVWLMSKKGLTRIGIASGAILARVYVARLNGAVLSTTGERIYDTVQVTPETEVIQAREGATGKLLVSSPPMQGAPPDELAIDAADAERLFTSFNGMGLAGTLTFYNPQLHVVASSWDGTNSHPVGTAIPGFGNDAGVNISGGIVWVTSYNQYACFNVQGELEAIGTPRADSGSTFIAPIIVSNSGDFSSVEDGAASGLYRIEPPKNCRT